MKTDLFQSYSHCWVFQICWHIECSTFTVSSFKIWNSSTGIPSPPLALFIVMLSKAHLTSHARMSGSRWVIISPLWLSWLWRSFWYSSVYSCHLFLISSASVMSTPSIVLYWAHLCMKLIKLSEINRPHLTLLISFHSNPKEGQNNKYPSLPENFQTTIHLISFPMLASFCSKSFRLGFHSRWTKKFQMYKLSFKEVKEQEAKLPPFAGSWRKQESLRKMSISMSLTMLRPLTVWVTTNCCDCLGWSNWRILKERGIPDHFTYLLRNLYAVRNQQNNWTGSKWGKEYINAVYLLVYMYT